MDVEARGGGQGATLSSNSESADALARFHEQLDLVDLIARQLSKSIGRGVEFDDLLSAGREGLLDAARRFDADRGIPFRAYANLRIRGAMIDGVRRMSALPRRAYERLAALEAANRLDQGSLDATFRTSMSPGEAESALADHLAMVATGCALGSVAQLAEAGDARGADADYQTPEEQLSRAELLARVDEVLSGFEEVREARVLRLVYFEGMTIEAAAREMDLDQSWASRLHTRGMDRLVKRMRKLL
jgi:RNA polymerase sigma factor FliA